MVMAVIHFSFHGFRLASQCTALLRSETKLEHDHAALTHKTARLHSARAKLYFDE
jgi:hypothetical protein